jgi:hypothetical protein
MSADAEQKKRRIRKFWHIPPQERLEAWENLAIGHRAASARVFELIRGSRGKAKAAKR